MFYLLDRVSACVNHSMPSQLRKVHDRPCIRLYIFSLVDTQYSTLCPFQSHNSLVASATLKPGHVCDHMFSPLILRDDKKEKGPGLLQYEVRSLRYIPCIYFLKYVAFARVKTHTQMSPASRSRLLNPHISEQPWPTPVDTPQ